MTQHDLRILSKNLHELADNLSAKDFVLLSTPIGLGATHAHTSVLEATSSQTHTQPQSLDRKSMLLPPPKQPPMVFQSPETPIKKTSRYFFRRFFMRCAAYLTDACLISCFLIATLITIATYDSQKSFQEGWRSLLSVVNALEILLAASVLMIFYFGMFKTLAGMTLGERLFRIHEKRGHQL